MKKNLSLLLVALFAVLSFNSFAQDVAVPEATKTRFAKKHPHATGTKWMQTKKGNFKAIYTNKGGKKAKAFFNKKGEQFLVKVYQGEPGKKVKAIVAKNAEGYKAKRVVKIKKGKDEKKVSYRVHARKGKMKKVILLNADKKFVKVLSEKEVKANEATEEEVAGEE